MVSLVRVQSVRSLSIRCLSDLQRRGTQLAAQSFILGVHRVMLHVRSVVM